MLTLSDSFVPCMLIVELFDLLIANIK